MAERARPLALEADLTVESEDQHDEGQSREEEVDSEAEPLERRARIGGGLLHSFANWYRLQHHGWPGGVCDRRMRVSHRHGDALLQSAENGGHPDEARQKRRNSSPKLTAPIESDADGDVGGMKSGFLWPIS